MSKISIEKQKEMEAQHLRDQIIASFSTRYRNRISNIAKNGPNYDDDEICQIMAHFILGEIYSSEYNAIVE